MKNGKTQETNNRWQYVEEGELNGQKYIVEYNEYLEKARQIIFLDTTEKLKMYCIDKIKQHNLDIVN
jgi:hypothetical protein